MTARSTADLIAELNGALRVCRRATLIVGFENSNTRFVAAGDPDALNTLNEHVQSGGKPVGIVGFQEGKVSVWPLEEFEEDEWAERYLITLLSELGRQLRDMGEKHVGPVRSLGHSEAPGEER